MGRITNYIPVILFLLLLNSGVFAQDFTPAASSCPFEVASVISEPSCQGGNDGSILLAISTTTSTDVDIRWLNLPDGVVENSPEVDQLPAGIYDCELSGGGCKDTLSFTVSDPPLLRAESNKKIVCDKETAIKLFESVTGGRPPYRFSYNAPNDVVAPSCVDCNSDEIVLDKTTTFQVTVKDSKGCQRTQNITITVAPEIEFAAAIQPARCAGEENAVVNISSNLAGNISNYSLVGSTDVAVTQVDPQFSDLAAGNYQIILEDVFGCTERRAIEITEPEALAVEALSISPVSCPGENDAGIQVSARGGNSNYRYSVDGSNFSTTNVFRNLAPGQYDLFLEDDKGCSLVKPFEIEEKPIPQLEVQTQGLSCPDVNDASFIVVIETIEGLYEDYEYSLNGEPFQKDSSYTNLEAGSYNLIARSNSGCAFEQTVSIAPLPEPEIEIEVQAPSCPYGGDASFIVVIETIEGLYEDYEYSLDGELFQKDSIFENLQAGFYTVSSRSNSGCLFQQTLEIQAPTEPDILIQTQNVSCPGGNDGAFIVVIETIEGLYEYSIDGELFQKDSIFRELDAGTYLVSVRNENACLFTQEVIITAPGAPEISIYVQDELCVGEDNGQITIEVTGGAAPFQYSIDNGTSFQDDPLFTGLSPGIYTVLIKDANGCLFSELVNIAEAQALQATFTINNASCNFDNGFIVSVVTGGKFPYQYNWSSGATEAVAKDLFEGNYAVTITDAANCELIEVDLELENEGTPVLSARTTAVNCNGEENGSIDLEVESEFRPLKYKWSTGATHEDLDELKAGAYAVTVVDANQCSQTDSYEVSEPEALSISLDLVQKLGEGFVSAEVNGGTGTYRFFWSTGSKEANIENLPEGNYSVTVVDDHGCNIDSSISFVIQIIKDINDHVVFYPNPTNGDLTIDISLPEEQTLSYDLIDELGRILVGETLNAVTTEKRNLDLRNFPAAIYFLRIKIGNDVVVKKLLKITK